MIKDLHKRTFDFVSSLLILILLIPVFAIIMIVIKVNCNGPVFYCAKRTGINNSTFKLIKFRTMVTNADKIGGSSTADGDPRITKIGKKLRNCKLDELPQLLNVLKGDMSLVGPRPEVLWKLKNYSEDEIRTLSLRPGITDWASIWNSNEGAILEGAPDPDAVYEEVIRPTKMKLQLYYLETHNIFEDIKIICHTILRVINKRWLPKELKKYPSFKKLRAEALTSIEKQKVPLLKSKKNSMF